jgi:hypothetical protein
VTVSDLLDRAETIVKHETDADQRENHIELLVSIGMQFYDKDENAKATGILQDRLSPLTRRRGPSARAEASCALAVILAATDSTPAPNRSSRRGWESCPPIPCSRPTACSASFREARSPQAVAPPQ